MLTRSINDKGIKRNHGNALRVSPKQSLGACIDKLDTFFKTEQRLFARMHANSDDNLIGKTQRAFQNIHMAIGDRVE